MPRGAVSKRLVVACASIGTLFVSVSLAAQGDSRPSRGLPTAESRPSPTAPAWANVIEANPDSKIIPSAALRTAIARTGLPWHVLDKRSGIEMMLIPPGAYLRGASPDDREADPCEKPAHEVTIAKPFYLGRFAVTNAQFRKFRPTHDSGPSDKDRSLNGDTQPVVQVSWDDAIAFLNSYGLRLPTEGEWEYAARAGTTGPRYGDLDAIAWYAQNSNEKSHPVGGKAPNPLGLHDMLGNVYQWCADWYAQDAYATLPSHVTDPQGPSAGKARVARGSSWIGNPILCRSSSRWYGPSLLSRQVVGFRAARTP